MDNNFVAKMEALGNSESDPAPVEVHLRGETAASVHTDELAYGPVETAESITANGMPEVLTDAQMQILLAASKQPRLPVEPTSDITDVYPITRSDVPPAISVPPHIEISSRSVFFPPTAMFVGVGSGRTAYLKWLRKEFAEKIRAYSEGIGDGSKRTIVGYQKAMFFINACLRILKHEDPVYTYTGPKLRRDFGIIDGLRTVLGENAELINAFRPYAEEQRGKKTTAIDPPQSLGASVKTAAESFSGSLPAASA